MNEFLPWFFEVFLPPLMPVITTVAIVIEVGFWVALALGTGWMGAELLRRRGRQK